MTWVKAIVLALLGARALLLAWTMLTFALSNPDEIREMFTRSD